CRRGHPAASDGTRIFHLDWYWKAQRALKTAQRRVARRTRGSHRRRKAVQLLAKRPQQVRRQRADVHHKTALALMREYDVIYHEDVQTANLLKNHHLAKSIHDAGWSALLRILAFKAAYAGKRVVAVPPADTSQRCSGCGRVERLIRPLACLSRLRNEPAPRRERCEEQREAWAEPSGRRGGSRVGELRIRGALAPAECQLIILAGGSVWRAPTDRILQCPLARKALSIWNA